MKDREIKAWQKRIDEIDAIVEPLSTERAEIKHKIIVAKSKFKVGDIIEWNGKKGRVIKIKCWCCDDPMWEVVRIKNDGSEGSPCSVRSYDNPILSQ